MAGGTTTMMTTTMRGIPSTGEPTAHGASYALAKVSHLWTGLAVTEQTSTAIVSQACTGCVRGALLYLCGSACLRLCSTNSCLALLLHVAVICCCRGQWAITCDDHEFGGQGNKDTGDDFWGERP